MPTYQELKSSLIQKSALTQTPILGEFELTSSCNFSCPMCYVKEINSKKELSTKAWKDIFIEAVQNGLLYALLTGGEPFIRPDFIELYEYLYDLGVKITIYSNGSLINQDIINCFKKRPPEFIGITIYGYNQSSYMQNTNNTHGFEQFDLAIDLLKNNHINFALRTIPMKGVYQILDEMICYVKGKNVLMGYHLYVGPKRNGIENNHQQRLNATELVDFEKRIKQSMNRAQDKPINYDTKYKTCAALKSAYFITWDGYMQPCAMVTKPRKRLRLGDLKAIFDELHDELIKNEKCDDCLSCDLKEHCLQCYARRTIEGNTHSCSEYLREVALMMKRQNHGQL
jgi:MoaA/NifB/PqqE/SkfB family radical SAM enzyme